MSKVVVKKVKLSSKVKDKDIAEMFNQMLGAGSVNMSIAYPRYERMRDIVSTLLDVLTMFNNSPFMKMQPELAPNRAEIDEFITKSRAEIPRVFSLDYKDFKWNLNLLDKEQIQSFTEVYGNAKKSDLIRTFIVVCDQLIIYKKHIADADNLSYKFITNNSAIDVCPFPFSKLNLRYVFSIESLSETTKRFLLVVLNKLYLFSHELYKEITSPDVNVEEFVEVIMSNIDQVRKQPGLDRCRSAFKKIEESVQMLKENFHSYYHDFIETQSSTVIMEHFIIDVSKNTKTDRKTAWQFKKIISYYRKIAEQQITNPKIKKLFEKFNENFKELDKHTENLVNVRKENAGSDDSDFDDSDIDSDTDSVDSEEEKLNQRRTENAAKTVDQLVAEIEKGPTKPAKTKQ